MNHALKELLKTPAEEWSIQADSEPSTEFTGWKVASVKSSPDNASCDYSGRTGEHSEFTLYHTKRKNWVLRVIQRTQWQGCVDTYTVHVGGDLSEILKKLPDCRETVEMYDDCNEYLPANKV